MIGLYYVGQKPAEPIRIQVLDDDGLVLNVAGYDKVEVLLLDNRNEEVDMSGALIGPPNALGQFYFNFPANRSVFETAGEYILQLKLSNNNGAVDYTSVFTIRVRELGGK